MHPSILEIFKTIIQKEKNVLLSPFCFEIIINLISQGTTGESQKELLGLLKTSNSDEEYVKLIEVLEKIKGIQPTSQFEQTNNIYLKDFITPKESFLKKIQENLPLKILPLTGDPDFIIESILNLKAKWKQKFEEVSTKTEFFHLANGEEVETFFIEQDNTNGHNETLYFQESNFDAIQIPLKDDQLCVEIYLPKKINGLGEFIKELTSEKTLKWNSSFQEVNSMEVVLPKFEINKKYDLANNFASVGLNKIFNLSWDFTPMFDAPDKAYISKITQENFFKLNEIGIEAGSISRFYGGIGYGRSPQKHILFEAKHPFLYLVREKKTNTILFIGTFEESDKNQDFTLINKNKIEGDKFSENSRRLSFRLGLLFSAYTLNVLEKHFDRSNEFTRWYIDKLWTIVKTPKGKVFDRLLEELSWRDWDDKESNTQELNISRSLRLSKEEATGDFPNQIRTILNQVWENLDHHKRNLTFFLDYYHQLLSYNLLILSDLNLRVLDYELFSKFTKLEDDVWGEIIEKENITSFFRPLKSKIGLSEKEKENRRLNASIRKLKPYAWNMSIRGAIYFEMFVLDLTIGKEIHSTKAKEILSDIKEVLTTDNEIILNKFKKLNFYDEQTGFFDASDYFKTVEEANEFSNSFPNLAKAAEGCSYLIHDYDYKISDGYTSNSFYHSTISNLKQLAEKRIPLPDKSFLQKYEVKNGNYFGDPLDVDLEIFSQL